MPMTFDKLEVSLSHLKIFRKCLAHFEFDHFKFANFKQIIVIFAKSRKVSTAFLKFGQILIIFAMFKNISITFV